jgi:G:T/U-mismatch repair DNA glycosylase
MINYDKFISDGSGITIIQNNGKEQHRYIPNYPLETGLEYLIIGTIHPNSKPIIDYYYGNVASFWKIIEVIYPTYSFDSPRKIRDWQSDFKIGITDTIIQCRRKKQTPLDSDLIVDDEDYNWALKDYVIDNCKSLKCFLFTSGEGKNAAYKNFKKIMGKEFEIVRNKCIVLPSPSGSSTLSFFKGKDEHYGLVLPFYNFLKSNHPEVLAIAKETFNLKKQTKKAVKRLPETGINYYYAYKVFEYRKHLPTKSL